MKTLKIVKMISICALVANLAACATKQVAPSESQSNVPDWVTNPVLENGLADTQCIVAKNGIGMNILKTKAITEARAELAKQIGSKVKAMDKDYQRMAEAEGTTSVGNSFESVSKQVTNENLSGSRPIKMGYVTMQDKQQYFCVMVAIPPELTKTLFKDLITESGNNVAAQNEAVLYERFLAEKAAKELDAEFQQSQ